MQVKRIEENVNKITTDTGEVMFGSDLLVKEHELKGFIASTYFITDEEIQELTEIIEARVLEGIN